MLDAARKRIVTARGRESILIERLYPNVRVGRGGKAVTESMLCRLRLLGRRTGRMARIVANDRVEHLSSMQDPFLGDFNPQPSFVAANIYNKYLGHLIV
jgi:hypothetical protein